MGICNNFNFLHLIIFRCDFNWFNLTLNWVRVTKPLYSYSKTLSQTFLKDTLRLRVIEKIQLYCWSFFDLPLQENTIWSVTKVQCIHACNHRNRPLSQKGSNANLHHPLYFLNTAEAHACTLLKAFDF